MSSWHVSTGRDLKPRDHLVKTPLLYTQEKLGQPGAMGWQKYKYKCMVLYLKSQTPNYVATE